MKKILHVILFSACFTIAYSQPTSYFKVANTGTLMKIEKVSTGGYITLGTDSNFKLQVIRWDNSFNAQWKYRFTDPDMVAATPAIVEANDGSFFMMSKSYVHTGCAIITKFSSMGILLWQKEYYVVGGNLFSFALSKASGTDHGFVFGGGQCSLSNYIIKCDPAGNIEWQQQYYYPLASGVITTWSILPEGNNYVVSSGYNTNSLLTFRIDASGAVLSHTAYTYSSMQIIPTRMVKLNSTNGYAILGNYNNSNNNQTQFLAILSNSLALTSFNELTISGYDQFELHDITAINNGQNLILDGSIYDNSTFYIATMNVSNTGTIVWKTLATGNSGMPILNVEFRGLTALGNKTVHVGYGYYEGAVVSIMDSAGNGLCNTLPFSVSNVLRTLALQSSTLIPIPSNAVADTATYTYITNVFSTQYLYCGGLPSAVDENENDITLNISPNPATTQIEIRNPESEIRNIQIYNILGEQIFSKEPTANSHELVTIDISDFTPGIYFVKVMNEQNSVTRRIVVQR